MAQREAQGPSTTPVRAVFLIAGLYDFLLGAAYLVAAPRLFAHFGVTPPNHWGYVHFAAVLLVLFGAMFFAVAARPYANRNLIPYGLFMKLGYCAVVAYHWVSAGIPDMWKPFAVIDLIWALLFLWAYCRLASGDVEERHDR